MRAVRAKALKKIARIVWGTDHKGTVAKVYKQLKRNWKLHKEIRT